MDGLVTIQERLRWVLVSDNGVNGVKRTNGEGCRSGEAGALSEIYMYNLARDYFTTLPGRLNAVTAEDAEAVAKKYLHPDQMILVCVGDRAKIEPELAKLDLGAVQVRDADGNIVK